MKLSIVKRILKWCVIGYLLLTLLVLAHHRRSTAYAAEHAPWLLLVAGFQSPDIVRSYWQFVVAGVWPYNAPAQNIELDELPSSEGNRGLSENPDGVFGSLDLQVQEGPHRLLLNYELGHEYYYVRIPNINVFEGTGRALYQIGHYFCLAKKDGKRFASPKCAHLERRDGVIYWHDLGADPASARPVKVIRPGT